MTASTTPTTSHAVPVSRSLEPIFDQFLDIQRRRLDELDQALAAGDLNTLERLGHAIKGGAATYQLPEAAALGARLEDAAVAHDLATAARLTDQVRGYFASLVVTFVA